MKVILDKSETFIELMEQKAATGEEFTIDEYTTNLAFDVIGEFEKIPTEFGVVLINNVRHCHF